jgi:hypothetical protein
VSRSAATAVFALTISLSLCEPSPALEIATFSVDVTPPLGHQLLTGGGLDATAVADPLFARGFVLTPPDTEPVVFVSVDWSEIRGEAYDRWREVLAAAAGTTRERVLVTAIHQHDTPLADLAAQRILEGAGAEAQVIDLNFHERTVQGVAAALTQSLAARQPVTHIGTGRARVEKLASNRRFESPEGKISYGRGSSGASLAGKLAPEGTIDPFLKTLSFWNGDNELCALHLYATHPMSYYRTGKISADFPGDARRQRQEETPGTLQIYASGASGNLTVGKYNNGKPGMRPIFAERLYKAMVASSRSTKRHPATTLSLRNEPLRLAPRTTPGFSPFELREKLEKATTRPNQAKAALGLSWNERCASGQPIDVPLLDLGAAKLLLLPAEIYIEYQLYAQSLSPGTPLLVAGYGECGPGYIPVERAWREKDNNLNGWCWINPGAEQPIKKVIRNLLIAK